MKIQLLLLTCLLFNYFSLDAQSYEELDSLAKIYIAADNYVDGFEILEQRLNQAAIDFDKSDSVYLSSLSWAAWGAVVIEDYAKAEAYYIEFLNGLIPIYGKDNHYYANDLGMLGSVYHSMGKYNKAAEMMEESRTILKRLLEEDYEFYVEDYGVILNNLALLYMDMSRYRQAELLFRESLQLKATIEDRLYDNDITVLNNLCIALDAQGKFEVAKVYYQQLLSITKSYYGAKSEDYAISLRNAASFYVDLGELDYAKKLIHRAIQVSENPERLVELARICRREGDTKAALQNYEKAILLAEKKYGEKHPRKARIYNLQAELFLELKQFEAAESSLQNAFAANSQSSLARNPKRISFEFLDLEDAIETQHSFAKLYQEKKQYKEAEFFIQSVLALHQKIRTSLNLESDKYHLQQQQLQLTEDAIEIALAQGDDLQAFTYAELNKAAILKDAFQFAQALPSDRLQEKRQLEKQYQLHKAAYIQADSSKQKQLLSQLNQTEAKLRQLEKELEIDFPHIYQKDSFSITFDLKKLQTSLEQETVLLEYFIGQNNCYLFVINQKELECIPLKVKPKDLKKHIIKYHNQLSNFIEIVSKPALAYDRLTQDAHWLYKELITPAASTLKQHTHYLIVPDAGLAQIPFSSFIRHLPKEQKAYADLDFLVKKVNLSYSYSAQFLLNPTNTKKATASMLAIAAAYEGPQEANPLAVRGGFSIEDRQKLRPLPSAVAEVEFLANSFEGDFLKGLSSTEAHFKKHAKDYQFIHLAMHGIVDLEQPILSGLVFSDSRDSLEDDFLQAYEIAAMELNADLVVLSACETGHGQLAKGEGIRSLARSFMRAGAASLLVSLWQVNDRVSAELMEEFYVNLRAGQSKALALRNAQLEFLKNNEGNSTHPAFWSSYVLLGDHSALDLKQNTFHYLYWILLALGVGILMVMLYFKISSKKPL
jgi:CHAT domain-containing protein/tetratricopeptide (TPR) repeat protein